MLFGRLQDLNTVFISIVLQSLPFILVGVVAAAFAELYLSDRHVARWLPRRRLPAVLLASLVGLVVPVCDCGAIPFARRLLAKGLPTYAGVTLILAAPVVNPVVALSTAVAFQGNWRVVALRLAMSLSVALIVGLLASALFTTQSAPAEKLAPVADPGGRETALPGEQGWGTVRRLIARASQEFFEVIFYVILGAFFTAATQTFVSRTLLNSVGGDQTISILVMMPLATILSLCSEADAFVARAFAGSFTLGSLFAFMVIGQVVDLRNGVLLFRTLRMPYVALIIVVSYVVVFLEALAINMLTPQP